LTINKNVAASKAIDRGLARLQGSIMLRQGALVFFAMMVLNVGGFVFHAVASRRLGVAEYGVLYTLISGCTIAAVPAALAVPVIARFAAEFRVLHDDRHVRRLIVDVVRLFGALALLYLVLAFATMNQVGAFLHVPAWTVPFVALMGGGLLFSSVLRAVAQGTQDYRAFTISCVTDGFSKVVALVVFMVLVLGLLGGVLGFTAGIFGGAVAVGIALSQRYRSVGDCEIRYDWRRIVLSGVGSAAITIAGALMGSMDVVLVKHFFDANQAGIYSAASLGGKVLLYFVGFIPTILLPQATERHVRGERTRYALAACVTVLVAIGIAGVIALKFFGIVLLHALVGHAFDAAASLLLPYGTAMVCLALAGMLGSYGIATHRIAFAVPLVFCVLGTLLSIALFHQTLAQVVTAVAIGNAVTVCAVAITIGVQAALGERSAKAA
jgi:O-antigen/teichoic acid export membrane protein